MTQYYDDIPLWTSFTSTHWTYWRRCRWKRPI